MIKFYNKNREVVMQLHDFSCNKEPETGVKFFCDISYVFYKASKEIECYKTNFDQFLDELKLIYDFRSKTAKFIPIESELEIYFNSMELGHILVSIKLNYFDMDIIMHESTLQIQYEIDQSFLPELITEIEKLLKNITK